MDGNRYKIRTKFEPKKFLNLTIVEPQEPRWNPNGTQMDPKWNKTGSKIDAKWNQNGTQAIEPKAQMEPRP